MKKLLLLLFLSFFLNACSEEVKSLEVGEIYRSARSKVSYEVISSTELEITKDGHITLATYSTKGNRIRVVSIILGTTQVEYFKTIPVGLKTDKKGGGIYYSREKYEIGLLDNAARKGDAKAVRSLLDKGIDVNSKGYKDRTALMGAARRGNTDVAKLLLERGAQINAKTNGGYTALNGAAVRGYLDTVRLLLDNGAEVNAKTKKGYTALMGAAWEGHTDVTKLLLERGAQINEKNGDGETALKIAKRENQKAIIRILTNAGATE